MTSPGRTGENSLLPDPDLASPATQQHGIDRRTFMMRSAVVGAAAVIAGCSLTAREMNAKYKETSEGGLAVSLVLC